MSSKLLLLVALMISAPGCAKLNSTGISFAKDDAQRLFIWKSNYSAGMGTNGGICAQGALTAFATNADFSASLPKETMPTELGYKQTQAVSRINSSNNQTAFANISLFYMCQIVLNSMKTTTTESIGADSKINSRIIVREPSVLSDQIVQMWSNSNQVVGVISQNSDGLEGIIAPRLDDDNEEGKRDSRLKLIPEGVQQLAPKKSMP